MAWREFAEKNPDLPVGFVIQGGDHHRAARRGGRGLRGAVPERRVEGRRRPVPAARADSEDDAAGAAADARRWRTSCRRWEKPALVAFSDSDPVFPYPRAGRALRRLIPTVSEQVKIEGAAHFLQEDRGEQIAGEILRVLA